MQKAKCPSVQTGLKLGLALSIVVMVISSPIFMFVNPAQVLAASAVDNSNRVDSSNYHSSPQTTQKSIPSTSFSSTPTTAAAPPMSSQGEGEGGFTTQAALTLTRSTQTSNIVDSKAYYDVSFRTSTSGVIKFIRMSFPAGTYLGAAVLIEATGIGPGTISAGAGGNTLAYTVTNAVNVPANTNIRLQIANANNPATPGNSLTVSITTRDSANAIIDGPASTNSYNMEQIDNAQIATGAVTTSKIATGAVTSGDIADGAITSEKIPNFSITSFKPETSFMKRLTVNDDSSGHARGWNPTGSETMFIIVDPIIPPFGSINLDTFVSYSIQTNTLGSPEPVLNCAPAIPAPGSFIFHCENPPPNMARLYYMVINLPGTILEGE